MVASHFTAYDCNALHIVVLDCFWLHCNSLQEIIIIIIIVIIVIIIISLRLEVQCANEVRLPAQTICNPLQTIIRQRIG